MKAVFFYTLKNSLIAILFLVSLPVFAWQKDSKTQQIRTGVNNQHFVFTAQTASPQSGRLIQLTSPFDIKLVGDSIISYLPFYGQAYVAPISTDDASLEFTSTDFTYNTEQKDIGKWEITIRTKNLRDNHKLFFTIFNNG